MKYYFVGIKGTGMSALAKVLLDLGNEVLGSDVKDSYFTDSSLMERNILIKSFNKDNIKEDIIYIASSCYDSENVEIKEILKRGYKLYYYHEFISEYFGKKKIGISGTHGKTTTAHIINTLFNDERKVSIIGDGYGRGEKDYDYFIFEACEYKNHFLVYDYDTLVINNIDLDHLDFFHNIDEVFKSFQKASEKCKNLIVNNDDEYCKKIEHNNKITFGFSEGSTIRGEIVDTYYNGYLLDVWIEGKRYRYIIPFPGKFIIYDFLAAISVYYCYNKNLNKVQEKIYKFERPKRRMQEYNFLDNVIIDDYAHHPSEIKECLGAIKQKYYDKKLIVIFQPHTYTRTLRLKSKFEGIFDCADEFYLAKTFSSKREIRNKSLEQEVEAIFNNPNKFNHHTMVKIKKTRNSVILFIGAGNISECIKKILKNGKNRK